MQNKKLRSRIVVPNIRGFELVEFIVPPIIVPLTVNI